jgi:hypothetical protein
MNNQRSIAIDGKGFQTPTTAGLNYWNGVGNEAGLFKGIRDCNIFLENVQMPTDIDDSERLQWAAEVKFVKAYLYFFLMRLYGPVPIIRENLPLNATPGETHVFRDPLDDVANYIVELCDEAKPDLMLSTEVTKAKDAGRPTQVMAAVLKARTLVWAASPLCNGNPDYAEFRDSRGVQLYSLVKDDNKWIKAAQAIKDALDIATEAGYKPFEYIPAEAMSDITKLKRELRGAVSERYNSEIVWPFAMGTTDLQKLCMPNLGTYGVVTNLTEFCASLKIAEKFYSRNGIPIEEDPEWINWIGGNFIYRYQTREASAFAGTGMDGVTSLSKDHQYYIAAGETTANLNFYREPRFYAYLGFDRGVWEANGKDEANSHILKARYTEDQGYKSGTSTGHIPTGYYVKK